MGIRKDITAEFLFDDLDQAANPHFSVSEVAKIFFARSSHWVRWREDDKVEGFVLDGVVLKTPRTEQGARYYTLPYVERMAHALAQQGAISGAQLANTLTTVEAIAKVHELM